jgi:LmbE family N-acetylglucosaminyl deacetylase
MGSMQQRRLMAALEHPDDESLGDGGRYRRSSPTGRAVDAGIV